MKDILDMYILILIVKKEMKNKNNLVDPANICTLIIKIKLFMSKCKKIKLWMRIDHWYGYYVFDNPIKLDKRRKTRANKKYNCSYPPTSMILSIQLVNLDSLFILI